MVMHLDPDNEGGGTIGGGGGGSGGTPPPGGSTNLSTYRYADVHWAFTEPQPTGRLTGFEVGIFVGSDTDTPDTGILAMDIIKVDDITLRRWIDKVVLRTTTQLRASVRAVFGELGVSPWAVASLTSNFVPDQSPIGGTAGTGGYRKLTDGTILQYFKTTDITQQAITTISWPIQFPNACLMVQITPEDATGDVANDAWFQIRTYDVNGLSFLRQSANEPADSKFNKAHIFAIGY